jgi:hypothetical protein
LVQMQFIESTGCNRQAECNYTVTLSLRIFPPP